MNNNKIKRNKQHEIIRLKRLEHRKLIREKFKKYFLWRLWWQFIIVWIIILILLLTIFKPSETQDWAVFIEFLFASIISLIAIYFTLIIDRQTSKSLDEIDILIKNTKKIIEEEKTQKIKTDKFKYNEKYLNFVNQDFYDKNIDLKKKYENKIINKK
ncbi:/ / hypothetical protein / 275760:276338 Reverse [Candidatus Hepatoplasma crinochetorum]|uniref:Uncharacterized protein n=1 Tax=Candidatus Hepatoplasma crinochetorum TaxID=295596 RepID=A0A0G7ZKY1_9MOLU|nr:/ / hypothetical protein / 275760:276338 Reverse [Candidatus Hepatoplasma crinochetorum]